jgi:transcriptional regulator with XRE-family HTH domain
MKYTLKQWRGVKGKTQAELAEISGVSMSKIAMWETISREDIDRISQALELKPSDYIVLP